MDLQQKQQYNAMRKRNTSQQVRLETLGIFKGKETNLNAYLILYAK
jgi:hypothetical protein